MDRNRVLVKTVLAQLNIDICGAPSHVLPQLISIIKNSRTSPYMFLWTGDGEAIAHGALPQIEHKGSVLDDNNALAISTLVPGLDAETLQSAIFTITSESLSIGRVVSYEWIGGIKSAYVIRILIGDKVYVLGA